MRLHSFTSSSSSVKTCLFNTPSLSLSITRLHGAEPDRETWQVAHMAFVQAFVLPPDLASQKKLAKLLKRPIPKDVADALFTYDGFLHGLGRMNLSCVMGPPHPHIFLSYFFFY